MATRANEGKWKNRTCLIGKVGSGQERNFKLNKRGNAHAMKAASSQSVISTRKSAGKEEGEMLSKLF